MKYLFCLKDIYLIISTQPRATVAVVIYTNGCDAYDCTLLIWKRDTVRKIGKSRDRTVSSYLLIFREFCDILYVCFYTLTGRSNQWHKTLIKSS